MKSSLGKILRKIRKGKNISLTSIADKYLSKSQISRFERGESEISCIRLINILDKMNVTLDEFMILYNNDNKKISLLLTCLNTSVKLILSKRLIL